MDSGKIRVARRTGQHRSVLWLTTSLLMGSLGVADSAPTDPGTDASGVGLVAFVVRHAEPVFPVPPEFGDDAPLNVIGQGRARALERLLSTASVEQVWTTFARRAVETAQPLAERRGLPAHRYDSAELEALAQELLRGGGRTLVVGHSDTVPELVALLGGEPGEPIHRGLEFDRLYVVVLLPSGEVTTIVMRYGDPLPDNWRELARQR